MPIYEYKCQDCGHQFEELVLGGREPNECPKCRTGKVSRLMSVCAAGRGSDSGLSPSGSGGSCGSGGFS